MKIFAAILALLPLSTSAQEIRSSLVNFSHLRHLTERVRVNGMDVDIVHIYANAPGYEWTDAGAEGIACVDDAARAAVVYLRAFELRGDTAGIDRARGLLKFVLAMETEDGEFYNFVRPDLSVNRSGRTSEKSFGWWAARAVWAMSLGSRVMQKVDSSFARTLERAVRRTFPRVEDMLRNYPHGKIVDGYRTPTWLLYESGADASSELALGLVEFYRLSGDRAVEGYIRKIADGMMLMQDGDEKTFPYGLHRSWQTKWHSWGNSQSLFLASAGKLLGDSAMIRSAEREARGWFSRLLVNGMMREIDCTQPGEGQRFDQIAYDVRPMALALLRLYDATNDERYLKMAGIGASWFFGNNPAGKAMYDPASGRCYDGISDSSRLNTNSGAESTVEALYTLLELEQYPLARHYVTFRRTDAHTTGHELSGLFKDASADSLELLLNEDDGTLETRER